MCVVFAEMVLPPLCRHNLLTSCCHIQLTPAALITAIADNSLVHSVNPIMACRVAKSSVIRLDEICMLLALVHLQHLLCVNGLTF